VHVCAHVRVTERDRVCVHVRGWMQARHKERKCARACAKSACRRHSVSERAWAKGRESACESESESGRARTGAREADACVNTCNREKQRQKEGSMFGMNE